MNQALLISLITWAAGIAMWAGGLFACVEKIQKRFVEAEFRHGVVAFAGGALLSAIALVLVPKGMENLSLFSTSFFFLIGGAFFMLLTRWLDQKKGSAGNLAAMLADYLPEAMALGATMTSQPQAGYLLAFLIGLQNFPEGFSSYHEMVVQGSLKKNETLRLLFILSFLGPVAGLFGHYILVGKDEILGAITLFSSGGILYLIFQDIAPQANLKNAWIPPFGAVLGFWLGMLGEMLLKL